MKWSPSNQVSVDIDLTILYSPSIVKVFPPLKLYKYANLLVEVPTYLFIMSVFANM